MCGPRHEVRSRLDLDLSMPPIANYARAFARRPLARLRALAKSRSRRTRREHAATSIAPTGRRRAFEASLASSVGDMARRLGLGRSLSVHTSLLQTSLVWRRQPTSKSKSFIYEVGLAVRSLSSPPEALPCWETPSKCRPELIPSFASLRTLLLTCGMLWSAFRRVRSFFADRSLEAAELSLTSTTAVPGTLGTGDQYSGQAVIQNGSRGFARESFDASAQRL